MSNFWDSVAAQMTKVVVNTTADGPVDTWEESGTEQLGRTSSQCERVLICKWADTPKLMRFFLGGGGTSLGAIFSLVAPQVHPRYPWLYCDSIAAEGVGLTSDSGAGVIQYEGHRLTLAYKNAEVLDGVETGSESLDYGSDILAPPQGRVIFQWANGNDVPPDVAPAIPITVIEFTYARRFQVSIPTATILPLIDHVNAGVFFGAPAGTVVYCGAQTQRRFSTLGNSQWDVTHKFRCRPALPWNSYFNPDTGAAMGIVFKQGGAAPLPSADLSPLIT